MDNCTHTVMYKHDGRWSVYRHRVGDVLYLPSSVLYLYRQYIHPPLSGYTVLSIPDIHILPLFGYRDRTYPTDIDIVCLSWS